MNPIQILPSQPLLQEVDKNKTPSTLNFRQPWTFQSPLIPSKFYFSHLHYITEPKLSLVSLYKDNNEELWGKIGQVAAECGVKRSTRIAARDWLNNNPELKPLGTSANPVVKIGYEPYIGIDQIERRLLKHIMALDVWKTLSQEDSTFFLNDLKISIENILSSYPLFIPKLDLFDYCSILKQSEEGLPPLSQMCIEQLIHGNDPYIRKIKLESLAISHFHKNEALKTTALTWLNNYPYRIRLNDLSAQSLQNAVIHSLRSLNNNCYSDSKTSSVLFPPSNPFTSPKLLHQMDNSSFDKLPLIAIEAFEKTLVELKKEYAEFTTLDPQGTVAIFKEGRESFSERQPVYLAQLLGLGHLVIDGDISCLENTTRERFKPQASEKQHSATHNPIGNLQRFILNGISPGQLKNFIDKNMSKGIKIYNRINLQSFQEGALFCLLTKQWDMHLDNAFLVKANENRKHYDFKLFDIGRCLGSEGYYILPKQEPKRPTDEVLFCLRSFFLCFEHSNKPLSKESIDLIKSWDTENIRSEFIVNDQKHLFVRRSLKSLNLLLQDRGYFHFYKPDPQIRLKELELDEILCTHIRSDALEALLSRIKSLQNLIYERKKNHLPPPSIRLCYEKIFPLEMSFFPLYEKVYSPEAVGDYLGFYTLEYTINKGVSEGKLSSEEAQFWSQKTKALHENPKLYISWEDGLYNHTTESTPLPNQIK